MEIVNLSPSFSPNMYNKFIYRKDYYDGSYDRHITNEKIEYGGRAFSLDKYIPLPEEIELLLGNIPEIKESMVYGKQDKEKKNEKELIITAKVIPNYEEIEKIHGKDLTDEQIYDIIWEKIKEVNRKLTSYKAIKRLEIKKDEFEKTTTMKIKRYVEIKKEG